MRDRLLQTQSEVAAEIKRFENALEQNKLERERLENQMATSVSYKAWIDEQLAEIPAPKEEPAKPSVTQPKPVAAP